MIDYSIKEILTGDVPSDGVSEENLITIGTHIDSEEVGFEVEDDEKLEKFDLTTTRTYVELTVKEGTENFHYNEANISVDNLIKAFGGSIVGNKWIAPVANFNGINKSLKIISKAVDDLHLVLYCPKTNVSGKWSGEVSNANIRMLQFNFKLMQPYNVDIVPEIPTGYMHQYIKGSAPTNGVVDDTENTFTFDKLAKFQTVGDYEFSINAGVDYNDVTVNPIAGLIGAIPIGDLLVRLKAVAGVRDVGFTLANKTAFTV